MIIFAFVCLFLDVKGTDFKSEVLLASVTTNTGVEGCCKMIEEGGTFFLDCWSTNFLLQQRIVE